MSNNDAHDAITEVVQDYFDGMMYGATRRSSGARSMPTPSSSVISTVS